VRAIRFVVFALALVLASRPAPAGEQRPFMRGSWQELRQEHSGHKLVVHFWGLTCGPCLTELPRWAQFIRERPKLDIVLIAADPVVMEPDAIAAALAKAGLGGAESWVFADPFTDRLAYEIDPQWAGELPYTVLISDDGSAMSVLGAADFSRLRDWAGRRASGPPKDK
jgi:thiol-disulfide isomerase/thioredoxin